jgi:hypothetical protein
MERYYTDKGFISKGASLMILDDADSKYFMLLPTTDMPETKGAPSTQAKTVLTDGSVTEVEGLQTNDQKTYTFNYHRDNIKQLKKYVGKSLSFLERNPDNTGEKYTGTMKFGRSALSVDGIVQGQMFITVNSAEELPIDDVRDIVKKTAVITTPLPDVTITGTNKIEIAIETSEKATVTPTSASVSIATATYSSGKLTITGVAAGYTMINLETSATGEATSYRSIAVEVVADSE